MALKITRTFNFGFHFYSKHLRTNRKFCRRNTPLEKQRNSFCKKLKAQRQASTKGQLKTIYQVLMQSLLLKKHQTVVIKSSGHIRILSWQTTNQF
jgi:hypothetical protein